MSGVSQGPGWWQTPGGRWRPPDERPDDDTMSPHGPSSDFVPAPVPAQRRRPVVAFLSSAKGGVVLGLAVVLVIAVVALVVTSGNKGPGPVAAGNTGGSSPSSASTPSGSPPSSSPGASSSTSLAPTSTTTPTSTTRPAVTTSLTSPADPAVDDVHQASGPAGGGNRVTITGSKLAGVTAVKFGDVAATSFDVNSEGTKIIVHPPRQSAGTVNVTVTTSSGTSVISPADQYTYLGARITKISPRHGPAGTMVIIIGTDFTGASAVSFGTTSVGTYFSVTSEPFRGVGTEIVTFAPAGGTGTVPIEVTTPGGTSTTSGNDEFTYTSTTSTTSTAS
jgi:hypothetical protein